MNDTQNSPPQNISSNQVPNQPTKARRKSKWNGLGCSLAFIFVLVGLVATVVLGGPRLLVLVDQTGTVALTLDDPTSPATLAAHRDQALAQLHGYGWVDKPAGVARIPIARAIDLVAEAGLPVASQGVVDTTDSPTATVDLADVNYTDDVLPIFEQHCAECHGADNPEEGLQVTTYAGVMAGSIYGAVIKPGDPDGSYLVELVATGQMPKRAPDLSQAEIDTIIAWVEAGAPESGAATTDPATTNAITDTQTTVDLANVSFQNHVLPIFMESCAECHGDDNPEEGLVLTSYEDVMAGSIYGSVVKPGAPDDSYLVELVSTGQMPKRGADLTADQIAVIVAWIEAGAPDN